MDSQELTHLIAQGLVWVCMNNGDTFDIPGAKMATVSDFSAAVPVRDEDGRLSHRHLSLVGISSVEELRETTGA